MIKPFSFEYKTTAIADLCSVDLTAPEQLQTENSISLLVGVWFDTPPMPIKTESSLHTIRYGFKSAKVHVETEDCRIDPQRRRHIVAYTQKIESTKTDATDKRAEAGAGIAAEILKIFPFFKGRATLGGEWGKISSETVSQNNERIREYYSVWPAPSDSWRLAGIASEEGVLLGQVLDPDEPMCHLIDDGPNATVEAVIRAELEDVWIETDVDGDDKVAANNRRTICAVLIKRALNRRRADADKGTGTVTLATARLARKADDLT